MKLKIHLLAWLVPALLLLIFTLVVLKPLKDHNIRLANEIQSKMAIPYHETWLDSVISKQMEISGQMEKYYADMRLNFIPSKNQDSVAIAFRNLLTENNIELQKFNYKQEELPEYNILNLQLTAKTEYEGLLKTLELIEKDFRQFKIFGLNIRKAKSELQFSLSAQAFLKLSAGESK